MAGWYRVRFSLPEAYKGKRVRVVFDGIYKNSRIWCNSYHIGKRPYGYTQISYDITDFVQFGTIDNEITVRVCHTDLADSRWFTGSGIYRKAYLVVEEQVHAVWNGVAFNVSRADEQSAAVCADAEIVNELDERVIGTLTASLKLCGSDEESVVFARVPAAMEAHEKKTFYLNGMIGKPKLWSCESPSLYELCISFEKEDENMTQMPEQEEAIFVKLGDENSHIPAGKTVIEYELSKLVTPDGKRILAEGIHLKIKGSEKICMIGANGAGKTTLLKKIAEELLNRNDIKAEYMPQTYEDLLDLDVTPVDYLDKTGDKEERTRIRTYLGSLKYTPDEMEHPIRELSGGQKAKVLLLRMSLSGANVLILDEPTRNFSPLSGPVIRKMLREFPGAVISISHDRKYIEEVCDKIYQLNPNGLQLIGD